MYKNIPTELKENAVFCLWKYEDRNGRRTKVPYQISGYGARANDKSTFTNYDSIVSNIGGYNGIGMGMFDGFGAIDIDDCVHDGELTELALDIIDVMNSYTEYSPSGNGIRIIFKADPEVFDKEKYYFNNRKNGLEIYLSGSTNRFVTLTGNVYELSNSDVSERSAEVGKVLEKYMKREMKAKNGTFGKASEKAAVASSSASSNLNRDDFSIAPGSFLSDASVIEKAGRSKQGEKFKALWAGSYPPGKSASEADQALCDILSFWCGGDAVQIDRLFRQSGLMRDKWERAEYRNATIRNAIYTSTEFYSPFRSDPADDFNDVLQTLLTLDPANNKCYRESDIGFGSLFADVFMDVARYVPERKQWYVYDGRRWVCDVASMQVMEMCKTLADNLLLYCSRIKDEEARTRYMKHCLKWQSRRTRETYLKEAQSVYPVTMSDFDADRHLFNCENGTLDLNTMDFREHRASDKITRLAPVMYVPEAKCERFEQYIDEVMSGDKEKSHFLQKILGYAITGDTKHECLFFLYGATTRNGKGTLMESVLRLMGDYGKATRAETISIRHGANSHAPSEDVARLAGIRFANISEPSKGLVLDAAKVKTMTGNDTLNARFLNENSFDFRPQFKLYINANYLPVINDMTLFTSGRVVIIPFERHFEEWEQDKTLKATFAKASSQSAILNWLIDGLKILNKEGLKPPLSVLEAVKEYGHSSNPMQLFAEDHLMPDPEGEERTKNVYSVYQTWCGPYGFYPENIRTFSQSIRSIGKVVKKRPKEGGNPTMFLVGFRLRRWPGEIEEENEEKST